MQSLAAKVPINVCLFEVHQQGLLLTFSNSSSSVAYSYEHKLCLCAHIICLWSALLDRRATCQRCRGSPEENRVSDDRDERQSAMEISGPTNVTHDCHVGFDTKKGTFTGLPDSWKLWLDSANIR